MDDPNTPPPPLPTPPEISDGPWRLEKGGLLVAWVWVWAQENAGGEVTSATEHWHVVSKTNGNTNVAKFTSGGDWHWVHWPPGVKQNNDDGSVADIPVTPGTAAPEWYRYVVKSTRDPNPYTR